MIFYIVLFLVCIALNSHVVPRVTGSLDESLPLAKINLSFLAFFLLVMVIGLRYGFGIDYASYLTIFDQLGNTWSVERLEPGFYFLNWIIKWLGGSGEVMIFVCFLISLYFLNTTIQKYSPYPELSYLIFFSIGLLFFYTSGIRQAIAVSLSFYSFRFILEKKPYQFIAIMIVAMTFHLTALIFIPVYFLARIAFHQSFLFVAYGASLVTIFRPLLLFELADPLISLVYGDRFSNILMEVAEIESKNTGLGLKVVFYNALTIFVIWMYDELIKDPFKLVLTNLFIFGMLSTNVFSGVPDIARLTWYYSSFMILFIPVLVGSFENFHLKITMYLFFFTALFLLLIRYLQTDVYFAVPYRSILFQ